VPIDLPVRIAFLKKTHLFHGLRDDEFTVLAEELDEMQVRKGEVIFEQDDKADAFYLIFGGSIRVIRTHDNKETQLAVLVKNDYFGEMAMVTNRRRSGTAIATSDSTLLVMSRTDFAKLYKRAPQIKTNLELAVQSRLLARRLNFKWLRSDEVIYFLARKHRIVLLQKLFLPVFLLTLPLALTYVWFFMWHLLLLELTAGISFFFILVWVLWLIADWGNDYYVVTNQRVVYLEKVVGIYDSRQESPLGTILSVGVEMSQVGKIFGYGDVVIRTFVGRIAFMQVGHPTHAAKMVEEYWNRTKEHSTNMEKEAMKNAIRKRLGLPLKQEKGFGEPASVSRKEAPPPPRNAGLVAIMKFLGINSLKLRYEEGENIIYRKHWVSLVLEAWVPVAGSVVTTLLFLGRLVQLAFLPDQAFLSFEGRFSIDTWVIAFLIAFVPFAGWLVYEVADWSNDKFEVTNDQIIDIDRKPFGDEVRNAAPLEGILGTSYERKGLLGNIFNFGTVHITVGGTKLAFEDVVDPATVQSDIDRRRMARSAKQNEARIAAERDRMAEWIATYHVNSDLFRREQEQNQKKPKNE
jgi:CRP-like cAMP-binding protein